MNRMLKAVALVSIIFAASLVQAGDVYARKVVTLSGSTNATWTIGKYDRPTIVGFDVVGALPTGATVRVQCAYGDDAAGIRAISAMVTDTAGAATTRFSSGTNLWVTAGDILTFGQGTATQAAIRVHYLQRDAKTN